MALQGSPPISLGDIVAEFGGPGSLTDYYRGGSYVPDTPTNSGVPTSGDIGLLDFLGAANLVEAHDTTITAVAPGGSANGYIAGSYGSIADSTYSDDRTTRTITAVFFNAGNVTLRLNTELVPNDDRTFERIIVNGTTYLRADATYDGTAPGSDSEWVWSDSDPFGSNPNPLLIYIIPE